MWQKLGDLIKGAVELNLKYSSTLLHVSTDYLKDFNNVLTESARSRPAPADRPAPSRPPLLIVGQLNETPGAAFPLSNHSDMDVNVTLLVQGELTERQVKLVPAVISLKADESVLVRVMAQIDDSLEVNRDYRGAVVAPGLSTQSVEFVVRRLPGKATPPDGGESPARG